MTDAAPTIHFPGILDIATSNVYDGTVSVLIGKGDGTFNTPVTFPVDVGPAVVAVGDVNGDGFPDIATANFGFPSGPGTEHYGNNDVSVLLGDGSGGFTAASGSPVAVGAGTKPFAVAVADLNGDGFGDLVVGDYGNSTVTVFKSNGNGTFTALTPVALPSGAGPSFVVTGDFNRDGKTDVITSNFGTGNVTVLLGDGSGGLTQKQTINVGAGPETIALGDINGDGITDMVVTNYNATSVSVLLGNGDGTFHAASTPTIGLGGAAFGVALGDVNGDGTLDMVVADFGNSSVTLFLGNGSGGFTAHSTPVPSSADIAAYSVSLADVNGDGILDMVLNARSDVTGLGEVVVMLGTGNGNFQSAASAAVYPVGRGPNYAAVVSFEPLTVNEHTSLVFSSAHGNAITVADVDGGSSSETVTLSVAHGTLTLGSTTGLTGLTGNGGASLSFSGTIAQLNAAMNGLTYTPTAQYHGADAVKVSINDNTGIQPATSSAQEISVLAVNNAPAGTDNTIAALEDTGHTFAASDFGFTDPNDSPANNLLAVEITTLPTAGTLKDNGVAVTASQFVSVTDINAGHLVFTPAANANGNGYAHFTFQVEDDGGTANGGVNLDQSANTITINLTPVNDAPVASGTTALALPNTVSALFSGNFDDSADNQPALPGGSTANTLAGIAITGDAANATTQGSWEYSIDGGTTWTDIVAGSVSATSALVLSSTAELRFVAVAGFSGAPGALTAHVIDNSTGNVSTTGVTGAALQGSSSSFTGIDIASHDGGSTPVSTGTASLTTSVPGVTSIHLAGSSPSNGASGSFTVIFSESVTGVDASDFTATTLTGNVAETGITVTPASGTTYTVTVNGVTGDGTMRLDLKSSGTGITDAAGNAIAGGFTSGDVYTIEHTAPAVTSVGVPSSATYIAGQNLDFTVHFSEAVNVTGTPELALTLDTGGTVDAQYVSGSGTSALTFQYTVISGEGDTNGVAVGSAILLNGGTVKDAATNDAVLTLNNVAATTGVLVDSIPPTVTSVVAPANGTYGVGEPLTFTVDFSKNVLVTTGGGTPYIDVTLDTGGTVHAAYTGGSGTSQLTFSYTVANGNDDTNGVAVGSSIVLNGGSIKDADTNAATLTLNNVASTTGVLVDAIPPTVTSIDTVDGNPNNLGTEHFTVTFSTAVTGVDATDFTVVGTNTASGSVATVTGSGATWTVTVNNVSGDGTLRLDLNSAGDPITDNFGNTLTAAHTGDQSYTVQHTAPAVTSVTVPANSTYVAGQNLDFTTTFSEAVTVTGTPRIDLNLTTGGSEYATYVSGSGTNTLTYQYIVAPGNQALTGITTPTGAIDLNGGTIKDAAGNAAGGVGLNLTGEPSLTGVDVDAVLPAVSSVTVPLNGTYGTSQDLDFSVNFTKLVNVNTGGGAHTPYIQLTLDTGGIVDAAYVSGSGSSTLTFRYVVASGEFDSNGITVGSNLVLNGGTIQDAIGNNAATTLNNVGSTAAVLVDSILPTVSSIAIADAGTNNLHTEHFTVTFSKDVSLHPPDTTDFTLHTTGTVGGTVASVTAVNGSTYTITVTNVTGDGTLRLDLNTAGSAITDAYGNTLTAAHTGDQSYTTDHTAPGAPTVVLSHDTGTSGTDGITKNPAIIVTPAEAGGTLLYKIDGATSYSTTAPSFAADGAHTVSVEQEDAAGNIGAATMLSFVLDTTAPAAPTSAVALLHDTGVSGTDHITSDPTLVFASPAAGDYFLFKVDNGSYSTTVPTAFATDHSADGGHTISVEEVDTAGNVSAPASFSLTLDTVAPAITAVTATPSNGVEGVGQAISIVLAFGETVAVSGGTPTLSLNDGGNATYDAAATAALHDPTKLVFDYTVSTSDTITSPLAVTGINLHGAGIEDLAGNVANLGNVATTFTGLGVDTSLVTASPDSNHVLAGQTVTADAAHGVLANDTDSNPADHLSVGAVDGLTADVNQSVAGAYGSLTVHADGSYSYTANNNVSGVAYDTFTYTASNGHSAPSTSTLSVEVTGGNQNFVFVPSGGSGTGGYSNTVLDGSAGHATLTAATTFNAHQILIGGDGDTLNAASYGQDTFVFANNFGHETINNFQPALDVIQLQQSQFGSLANVLADIHQVGADSVLTLDASHVITIAGIQHTSLTAADFHLV